jgi:hypothetical protein
MAWPQRHLFSNVSFSVEGISERVGVRIVTGQEREAIVEANYPSRYRKRPAYLLRSRQNSASRQAQVNLIWGCFLPERHCYGTGSCAAL